MTVKTKIETLVRNGFILVFNQDKLDVVKTAEALTTAGINNMEITCRIKKPLEKIERLRKELPEFITGAASLVDSSEFLHIYNERHKDDPLPGVQQVVDAGAGFLVSAANFSTQTYEKFAGELPIIPGCGTVTEIIGQFSKGANLCKIFPAKQLGDPAFVKAIDPAIHKTIALVPTGGTNMDNIPDYIAAGILVLGGSFSVIEKSTMQKIIDQQDCKLLARELTKIKQSIDQLRNTQWPDIDFSSASLKQISRITGRDFNVSL